MSESAITHGQAAMQQAMGPQFPVFFHLSDMLSFLQQTRATYDVVVAAFALHHLTSEDKAKVASDKHKFQTCYGAFMSDRRNASNYQSTQIACFTGSIPNLVTLFSCISLECPTPKIMWHLIWSTSDLRRHAARSRVAADWWKANAGTERDPPPGESCGWGICHGGPLEEGGRIAASVQATSHRGKSYQYSMYHPLHIAEASHESCMPVTASGSDIS